MSCILTAISGCATTQVPTLVEGLNAEASCCSSYSEFEFVTIPPDKQFTFPIGPADKAYLFPLGKSYFKPFRLPEFNDSRSITVKTYVVGNWIPTSHVFVPFFTFLDHTYTPIDDAMLPELVYDIGFVEGAGLFGVVDVPSEARYVVLHTSPEFFYYKIGIGSAFDQYADPEPVSIPSTGSRAVTIGPSGTLRVRFVPGTR